jgi:hypothetical protein
MDPADLDHRLRYLAGLSTGLFNTSKTWTDTVPGDIIL